MTYCTVLYSAPLRRRVHLCHADSRFSLEGGNVIASALYHVVVQYSAVLDTVLSEVEATAGGLRRGASVDHARHVQLRALCSVCVLLLLYIFKYQQCFAKNPYLERATPLLTVYPIDEPLEQLDH